MQELTLRGNLRDFIFSKDKSVKKARTPLKLLQLQDQIVNAIEHMHNRNIHHKDLEPENILLTDDEFGNF